jgi:hypothetical protein
LSDTDPVGKPVHVPRPARIKAAVLRLALSGPGKFEFDEALRIDHVGTYPDSGTYFALLAGGVVVATAEHPALLSDHAFRNGAGRVVHNYDLRLAE